MKKSILTLSTILLLLSACGKDNEQSKEIKKSEVHHSDKSENKKEKPTTEKPTTEKPTSESIETEAPTVEKAKGHGYSFIDDKGYINILDPAFIDYYFSGDRTKELGPVRVGMTKSEVEKIFGPSQGRGLAAQYPMSARYGDIAVDYQNDKVTTLYVNTSKVVSINDIRRVYGKPTIDMNQYLKENKEPVASPSYEFVYDDNDNNGFAVIVIFDKMDGNVKLLMPVDKDISKEYKTALKSAGNSQSNEAVMESQPNTDLEYLAEVKQDIENLEANPSDEHLKYMLWNKLIRGVQGEKFKDNPKLKAEALDVFNRYSRINPDAERYRDMYDY